MMSDAPVTERQQYRLDHIRSAEAFDGSIADYARTEGLKRKELFLETHPGASWPAGC
jgi:hypothetical protein